MKLLAIFLLVLSSLALRAGQVTIEDEEPFFRSLTRSIAAITNSCGDFSLVISDGNYTGGGVNGVTNNPHDFTGSKVIVATVTSPNGDASSLSFASVPANTWVAGTAYTGAAGHVNQPYYCLQPTTSNGMYFYALSGNQTSVGFTVQGFSSSGTVFLDSQTGSTGSGSSIQPGSLTVHGTNLYVAALTFSGGSSFNGPSGFSSPQDSSGGGQPLQCYALTNTTQNPTWTMTSGTGLAASMLMFGSTGCSGGCGTTIAQGDIVNQDFSGASAPSGWTSSGSGTLAYGVSNPNATPCQLTNKVLHASWSGTSTPYSYWDKGAYSCATYYFRFYFYVGSSAMGTSAGNFIDIFDADEATAGEGNDFRCCLLQQATSSSLGFFVQFAGGTASSTNNISTGGWYRGEVQYVNNGAVAVKLYDASGTQVGTTYTGTSANNKCFRFISTGVVLHNNTASADVYVTGVGVSSTGFLGP